MRFFTADEVRAADEAAIHAGTPPRDLMRRAARGIAGALVTLARASGIERPRILLAAGRGNNGGDALAAACLLLESGWNCEVWLAADPASLTGDPAYFLSHYTALGGALRACPAEQDWPAGAGFLPLADLVVDGLLGTGAKGAPRGVTASAVRWINALSAHSRVVALDFPSGVDATTGQTHDPHVTADLTLCISLPKSGLLQPAAQAETGPVEWIDIGLSGTAGGMEPFHLITRASTSCLPPRRHGAHKGEFGRMLIIGGSPGLTGAPGLAARGALHAGAGLVDVLVPPELVSSTAASVPEAMVHAGETGPEGGLSVELFDRWNTRMPSYDAVLAGPGMGRGPDSLQTLRKLLLVTSKPVVLDADGLSSFAGRAHWIEKSTGPVVLTPHPGELAKMMGMSVEQVQADRLGAATALAKVTGAVVVLKGAGTLVVQSGASPFINLNGNPGLARGGSGDVLAGLLAGIIAQGVDPFQAACLAVYLHGRAGDLAAWRHSPAGMRVTDVADAIPLAWQACGVLR